MDEETTAERQKRQDHRTFQIAVFIGLVYALGDAQGHIGHGVSLGHHLSSFAVSWGLITLIADFILDRGNA